MWNRIKELMSQADQSTSGQPALHAVLQRPQSSLGAYAQWKNSSSAQSTLRWILSNYHSYVAGGKVDRSIAFLNSTSKNGFVLYLSDDHEETRYPEYLMDFLKERTLELGYFLYSSDLKTYSSGKYVETQQRHYLKPPLNFVPNEKLSQLFGNISIDFILQNDKPYLFKLSATTYQDHMFENADKFDQLIKLLCVH